MLTSTLGEDVHLEVSLSDLFLVVVLVAASESLSTSLEFLLKDHDSLNKIYLDLHKLARVSSARHLNVFR